MKQVSFDLSACKPYPRVSSSEKPLWGSVVCQGALFKRAGGGWTPVGSSTEAMSLQEKFVMTLEIQDAVNRAKWKQFELCEACLKLDRNGNCNGNDASSTSSSSPGSTSPPSRLRTACSAIPSDPSERNNNNEKEPKVSNDVVSVLVACEDDHVLRESIRKADLFGRIAQSELCQIKAPCCMCLSTKVAMPKWYFGSVRKHQNVINWFLEHKLSQKKQITSDGTVKWTTG